MFCVYVRVKPVPLNSGCGVHRFKSYVYIYQGTGVSSGAVTTPWIYAQLEGTNESVLVQVFGPGPGLCLALAQLSMRFVPAQAGVGFIKLQ